MKKYDFPTIGPRDLSKLAGGIAVLLRPVENAPKFGYHARFVGMLDEGQTEDDEDFYIAHPMLKRRPLGNIRLEIQHGDWLQIMQERGFKDYIFIDDSD